MVRCGVGKSKQNTILAKEGKQLECHLAAILKELISLSALKRWWPTLTQFVLDLFGNLEVLMK